VDLHMHPVAHYTYRHSDRRLKDCQGNIIETVLLCTCYKAKVVRKPYSLPFFCTPKGGFVVITKVHRIFFFLFLKQVHRILNSGKSRLYIAIYIYTNSLTLTHQRFSLVHNGRKQSCASLLSPSSICLILYKSVFSTQLFSVIF